MKKVHLSLKALAFILFLTSAIFAEANYKEFLKNDVIALPKALSQTHLRDTRENVNALYPHDFNYKPELYPGIEVSFDFSYIDALYDITVSFEADKQEVHNYLMSQWGEALVEEGLLSYYYYWIDEANKMRVKAQYSDDSKTIYINYSLHTPIEEMFDPKPTLPTEFSTIMLGQRFAEIKSALPKFDKWSYPYFKDYFDVSYDYELDSDSLLQKLTLKISNVQDIKKRLVKKWGEPEVSKEGVEYWYNKKAEYLGTDSKKKKGLYIILSYTDDRKKCLVTYSTSL